MFCIGIFSNAYGQFSEQVTVCNSEGQKIVFYTDGTVRVSNNGQIAGRGTYKSGGSTVELFLTLSGTYSEWEGTYLVSRETGRVISVTINRSKYTPCR